VSDRAAEHANVSGPTGANEPAADIPRVPFLALDTLWFQVAGTLCNLTCTHCFISCSPTNHTHEMMSMKQVEEYLREAEALGVRDYGVTGGEPFLHPQIFEILGAILARGPVLVLTNGMLVSTARAERLAAMAVASDYSLDVRVSLDAPDASRNDLVRGHGSFAKAVEGIRQLAAAGLEPAICVTRVEDAMTNDEIVRTFAALLAEYGVRRPRIKVLEPFRIGAEAERTHGYDGEERITFEMMDAYPAERLQCSTSRMATERGVWVCPILVNEESARMGETLAEALRPFPLASGACWTCHRFGVSCRA
jgi:AdoMet-dependent heme synthase